MALSLDWNGGMKFSSGPGEPAIRLDSGDPAVTSPTQALAYGVMGCMAIDVVHILQKGRHDLKALKVHFDGDRAEEPPRRYTAMRLRFDITGDVPGQAVERAIALSCKKYCSVSNSLRRDIALSTTFTISR